MTNRIYKLGLEEKGQDFKTLYVQEGVIIHVEPPVGRVWCGKELSAMKFAPQDPLSLKGGPRLTYGVEHVEIYEAKISYGDWLVEMNKMAQQSQVEPDYTRRGGAMTRNAPWVEMYLRETVLVATLAREAMLQEA